MEIPQRGDFESIYGYGMISTCLAKAFRAIDRIPGGWAILARGSTVSFILGKINPGFRSSVSIYKEIERAVSNSMGNSRASFSWIMRDMESIAKLGWEKYATDALNTKLLEEKNNNNVPTLPATSEREGGGKRSKKYKKSKKAKKSKKSKTKKN